MQESRPERLEPWPCGLNAARISSLGRNKLVDLLAERGRPSMHSNIPFLIEELKGESLGSFWAFQIGEYDGSVDPEDYLCRLESCNSIWMKLNVVSS